MNWKFCFDKASAIATALISQATYLASLVSSGTDISSICALAIGTLP
ncbi:hypothetical protein [Scytonema sp. NUACC26]